MGLQQKPAALLDGVVENGVEKVKEVWTWRYLKTNITLGIEENTITIKNNMNRPCRVMLVLRSAFCIFHFAIFEPRSRAHSGVVGVAGENLRYPRPLPRWPAFWP